MMGLETEVESKVGSCLMRYFAYAKKLKSPGMIQSLDWQSQPCGWKEMAYDIHPLLLSILCKITRFQVTFLVHVICKRIILFE